MRSDTEKLGFSLQLKNDDALNEWNINLFGFSDCPLAEVRQDRQRERERASSDILVEARRIALPPHLPPHPVSYRRPPFHSLFCA